MGYRKYSDAEKTEAIVRLAINKYDYEKTAEQLRISDRTLRRWDKDAIKNGVPELLERAIQRLLMVIPENMSGHDWSITLGILLDKWLLLQGEPTERTENLLKTFGALTDDERQAVIHEAQEIVGSLSASGDYSGNGREV